MILISGAQLPVDLIADACGRSDVHELAAFGSAARGDMRPDSNIDILVEFGRRVELVTKGGLKPRVRPDVLREAQVVYAA